MIRYRGPIAIKIANDLLPFLLVKKTQAETLINLGSTISCSGNPLNLQLLQYRKSLFEEIRKQKTEYRIINNK